MMNTSIKFLLALSLAFLSAISLATEDMTKFDSKAEEELYRALLKELRCPKCQNQNIADSNAVVAKDMRVKTKELVEQGQDKQQVIDYMVNRYGQFAHYKPPINVATIMLWLLPVGFIVISMLFIVKRSKKPLSEAAPSASVEKPSNESELDSELEQLLSEAADKEKK